jgi:hypothetical protein
VNNPTISTLTIACGCGRKMTADGLRGPGAYRCGCGARIKAQVPPRVASDTVCELAGCDQPIWHERLPETRLCAQHFERIRLEIMPFVFAKYPVIDWMYAARKYEEKYGDFYADLKGTLSRHAVWSSAQSKDDSHAPLVYFIVWGDRCKIGTTTKLAQRISALSVPKSALAMTLPGDGEVERAFHQHFRQQRIERTEWFTLAGPVQEFIDAHRESAA